MAHTAITKDRPAVLLSRAAYGLGMIDNRRNTLHIRRRFRPMQVFGFAVLLTTVLAACAPAATPSSPAPSTNNSSSGARTSAAPARQTPQRPLVMALREEPPGFSIRLDRDGLDLPFTVTLAY